MSSLIEKPVRRSFEEIHSADNFWGRWWAFITKPDPFVETVDGQLRVRSDAYLESQKHRFNLVSVWPADDFALGLGDGKHNQLTLALQDLSRFDDPEWLRSTAELVWSLAPPPGVSEYARGVAMGRISAVRWLLGRPWDTPNL